MVVGIYAVAEVIVVAFGAAGVVCVVVEVLFAATEVICVNGVVWAVGEVVLVFSVAEMAAVVAEVVAGNWPESAVVAVELWCHEAWPGGGLLVVV